MKRGIWIGKIIVLSIVGIAVVFGFIMATMYLWNWLVPDLFGGPVLNFWQALGLLALSKILFSGFGKGGGHNNRWKSRWKSRWQEKWNTMSPEDRERFKEKMKDKWCVPREKNSGVDSGNSIV